MESKISDNLSSEYYTGEKVANSVYLLKPTIGSKSHGVKLDSS